MSDTIQIDKLNEQAQELEPREILARTLELLPDAAIAFSGAEDVALVAMAVKIKPDVAVFTLDTGRLHPQTYRFIEDVRTHYRLNLEILTPERAGLEALVREKGLFSFYRDGHEECCEIRKIRPLRRKLAELDGWITGQRRDQSPTRNRVPVYQMDASFQGRHGDLVKVNPLANWSLKQVWDYIRLLEVPYNPLHDQGFISIGCEPCTRAVGPGQHEREGRWWWEEATIKECGLHRGNLNDH
ncbi:MAG: phosphoadenylyl-sulfate reductase [Gammaproteobacteria bacterium]|nr:phosphoadenylyl-sulfate reductase [Pseudomonadales bacterium]MCP5346173.1 phosphoadenylyl-sulfate reductase [Pseudomonadales bacterium]